VNAGQAVTGKNIVVQTATAVNGSAPFATPVGLLLASRWMRRRRAEKLVR
jgi:hypothetical protein